MIWRSSRLALLCQTCNECEAFKTIKKPKCAGPFCILMSLQIFIYFRLRRTREKQRNILIKRKECQWFTQKQCLPAEWRMFFNKLAASFKQPS